MSKSIRHPFEVTSGISGQTLSELIAASCLLSVMLWLSWIAWSSLRQLRDGWLTVGEAASRIAWAGGLLFLVVALIAYVG